MKPTELLDCRAVAQDLLSQPEFFSDLEREPTDSEVIPLPKGSVERYTGARSTSDEHKALRVGAMRLLGVSDREIERQCGVDRRTIPHLLSELEKTGRLPAIKERLLVVVSSVAEQSGFVLRDLLDIGDEKLTVERAAMIKSVATALGISSEKVLLLTGSATEIVEHKAGAGREEFEKWWQAKVVPVQAEVTRDSGADRDQSDSKSPPNRAETEHSGGFEGRGHDRDTSVGSESELVEGAGPGDSSRPDPIQEEGGGVGHPSDPKMSDESTGLQNCSQEAP